MADLITEVVEDRPSMPPSASCGPMARSATFAASAFLCRRQPQKVRWQRHRRYRARAPDPGATAARSLLGGSTKLSQTGVGRGTCDGEPVLVGGSIASGFRPKGHRRDSNNFSADRTASSGAHQEQFETGIRDKTDFELHEFLQGDQASGHGTAVLDARGDLRAKRTVRLTSQSYR